MTIGTNKVFSGEFRVFHRKWSFVSLGVTMEVFVGNVKCDRMKFVQFVLLTGLFPSGEMVQSLCLKEIN